MFFSPKRAEKSVTRIFEKPDPLPYRRHLLLVGPPRSGTTLLTTMIGKHSDVGMANEDVTAKCLRKITGKLVTGNKLCIPNQIQLRNNLTNRVRVLKKIGLAAEAPRSKFAVEDYLELPNLQVLGIIRDGNDSVSSMMVRGESGLKKAARRWGEAIESIYELMHAYPKRVMVIRFEHLVSDPVQTLTRVCQFIGIAYQPQMIESQELNPYYPGSTIDTSKVHRHRQENFALGLEAVIPVACDKYRELVAALGD